MPTLGERSKGLDYELQYSGRDRHSQRVATTVGEGWGVYDQDRKVSQTGDVVKWWFANPDVGGYKS